MISPTQIAYGSCVRRHGISRCPARNQRTRSSDNLFTRHGCTSSGASRQRMSRSSTVLRDKPSFERLPAPAGKSPFRMKGQAFVGHMKYVAAHLPGGTKTFLGGIADPEMRAFFEQPFLASSWYDVFPLVAAGSVCAKIAGVTLREFLRTRTRWQAERDINGVYRFMLNLVSPEAVAMRMPRLIAQY